MVKYFQIFDFFKFTFGNYTIQTSAYTIQNENYSELLELNKMRARKRPTNMWNLFNPSSVIIPK